MSIKTADEILKEMAECENPVTVSSLKTIAISKLKQERDALLAEKATLIANIRSCVKCPEIVVQENGISQYVGEAYPESDIEAILAKYEAKP